jgi:F0F1-type ATP synthase membrane subunit b/b'
MNASQSVNVVLMGIGMVIVCAILIVVAALVADKIEDMAMRRRRQIRKRRVQIERIRRNALKRPWRVR